MSEWCKLDLASYAAAQVPTGARVLDAGAGDCPHRHCFDHAVYESCDIVEPSHGSHTFLCSLESIPRPGATYDAVLCIQVLDDVPDPEAVLRELRRVLKPGGSLFLSAPQSGRVHNPPWHFFHFTRYGLARLFERTGFEVLLMKPWGGIFWELSYVVSKLPRYLYRQHAGAADAGMPRGRLRSMFAKLLYYASLPACSYGLPLLFFYADRLDRTRDFTIGYTCHCRARHNAPAQAPSLPVAQEAAV